MSLYTSKNGLADCKHRQIMELGLAFVTHASLPFQFWDDFFERGNNLLSLFFLVIVLYTKATDLSILQQVDYTSQVM